MTKTALQAILDGTYTGDKKAISGYFISVNQFCKVKITAGLVRVDDKSAAIEAGELAAPECPDPAPKSPFSQKLTADMQAIRLAAMQSVLLAKPDFVLDLLAFGHSEASGHVESVFHLRIARPVNVASIEDGFAHEPRLDHGLDPNAYWQDGTRIADLEDVFASFRAGGKKAHNAVFTEAFAPALPYLEGGETIFAPIAAEAKADIRPHLTPTAENFFNRVSAATLADLFCAFLSCDACDARVIAFAKLKKAEKAEKLEKLIADPTTRILMGLTSEQKEKLAVWVPDCL